MLNWVNIIMNKFQMILIIVKENIQRLSQQHSVEMLVIEVERMINDPEWHTDYPCWLKVQLTGYEEEL